MRMPSERVIPPRRACPELSSKLADRLDRSGIGTAVDHQRASLSETDIEVETTPWQEGHPA